uniref:serine--tRNA ligase n=1 Tax=Setaria viridis TaxID=4556 RepID=A0A4U6V8V3_SETVI|nr:hypothetical protein SEVIR_4G290300v2 [Setaria viridis]
MDHPIRTRRGFDRCDKASATAVARRRAQKPAAATPTSPRSTCAPGATPRASPARAPRTLAPATATPAAVDAVRVPQRHDDTCSTWRYLFRTGEPGLDVVRESQLHRFAATDLVDEVVALDDAWRRQRFCLDKVRQELNSTSKRIGKLKVGKQDDAAKELMDHTNEAKKRQAAMEAEVHKAKATRDATLISIGNILHKSVPVSADEANNVPLRTFGERRMEEGLKNHLDLCLMLDIVDLKKGVAAAGGRGYYLKEEGYKLIQTPLMMTKEAMGKCAQLSQYDEELYKLEGEGKFLIATSEQPLACYHQGEQIHPDQLPIRYVEAGSHGRDTAGIYRTHEFQKIEQFCITGPDGDESWEMHEEMIKNSEDFYRELGIAGQIVNVVSGALNIAAAKKYDLERWFPASKNYRELVSCSNCTDYQARRLGITNGQRKRDERSKKYVHTLNSTLTATERTLCCILETYQKEDGVEVPKVLQPYMCGIDFLPFKKPLDGKQAALSKSKKSKGNVARAG